MTCSLQIMSINGNDKSSITWKETHIQFCAIEIKLDGNHTLCYNKRLHFNIPYFLLLHSQAIEKGDKDAIEKWLKREGPNLNCLRGRPSWWLYSICMDGYGTPLHWAAFYGQLDIAKLLIDSGASMWLNDVIVFVAWLFVVCLLNKNKQSQKPCS